MTTIWDLEDDIEAAIGLLQRLKEDRRFTEARAKLIIEALSDTHREELLAYMRSNGIKFDPEPDSGVIW